MTSHPGKTRGRLRRGQTGAALCMTVVLAFGGAAWPAFAQQASPSPTPATSTPAPPTSNAQAATPTQTLPSLFANLPSGPDWLAADAAYAASVAAYQASVAATQFQLTAGADYSLSTDLATSSPASSSLSVTVNAGASVLPWAPSLVSLGKAGRSLVLAALTQRDQRASAAQTLFTRFQSARLAALDDAQAAANVALATEKLNITQRQAASGAASADQVASARQALAGAQSNAASAANNLAAARMNLFASIGAPSTATPPSLSGPAATPPEFGGALADLLSLAGTQRADVAQAQANLQNAQDALSAAQFDRRFPASSVGLAVSNSNYGRVSSALDVKNGALSLSGTANLLSGSNLTSSTGTPVAGTVVTVSASISLPIIAPSGDAAVNSAQAGLRTAQLALSAARLNAELAVRGAVASVSNAQAALAGAQAAAASAGQALATAQARLRAGTGTSLDVSSASLASAKATRDLEAADWSLISSILGEYAATGTFVLTPQGAITLNGRSWEAL